MGLFTKRCPICGMEVDKEKAVEKFGKYFCSEDHAEEYRKKNAEAEAKSGKRGGGCC